MPAKPQQNSKDKQDRLECKRRRKEKSQGDITPGSGNHKIRESGEAIKCELSCIIIARGQGTLLYKGRIDTMKQVKRQENGSRRETPW
jgi:hypothetical protein